MSSSNSTTQRVVTTAEDLVFYTDTDQKDYPIFITSQREVYVKKRPADVAATFYVKSVSKIESEIVHELLEKAIGVLKEVTNHDPEVQRLEVVYEVYQGDMEKLLGEAKAYTIRLVSVSTPYSGVKYSGNRAWAIGHSWKKRIIAKAPELEEYIYLKGEEGKKGRAYVNVIVKLPVVTEELNRLFNMALASVTVSSKVSVVADLEEQVKKLEELIKQKEAELQALREQLSQLKLKLQFEQMKMKMVE
ncbi:MAG: hypothetical protein NWE99_06170 [Candidatus Bathyarchaeota archaeon]|nr:hypothetical protein [Candidatus Bathyarchaeota archaeon]